MLILIQRRGVPVHDCVEKNVAIVAYKNLPGLKTIFSW